MKTKNVILLILGVLTIVGGVVLLNTNLPARFGAIVILTGALLLAASDPTDFSLH